MSAVYPAVSFHWTDFNTGLLPVTHNSMQALSCLVPEGVAPISTLNQAGMGWCVQPALADAV